jgi:hypothetical protein
LIPYYGAAKSISNMEGIMKRLPFLFLLFLTSFVFAKKEYTGKVVDDTIFVDNIYPLTFSVPDSFKIPLLEEKKKKNNPLEFIKSLGSRYDYLKYYALIYLSLDKHFQTQIRSGVFSKNHVTFGKLNQSNIKILFYVLEKPSEFKEMKYTIEAILDSNKTEWGEFYYTSSGKLEEIPEPNFYLQYKSMRKTLDVKDGEIVNFNCYF